MKTAASVLARRNHTAALVTEPRAKLAHFKHVQLISTHGHLVLMVLVLEGGNILQQMLTLEDVVEQERLTNVAAMINDLCIGETSSSIRARIPRMTDVLAQEVMELVADVLSDAEARQTHAIHWYGFGDLVNSFDDGGEGVQQVLRILDEKTTH